MAALAAETDVTTETAVATAAVAAVAALRAKESVAPDGGSRCGEGRAVPAEEAIAREAAVVAELISGLFIGDTNKCFGTVFEWML